MTGERYHFLDGLRGVAMLLGIVLHGLMSFLEFPIWPAVDVEAKPDFFWVLFDAIHGFRMPLFFLVSGFFTAMMWKKRGTKGLVKQRALRIGVPLIVGTIVLVPMIMALGYWGGQVKAERREAPTGDGLMTAILENDLERVNVLLEEGADANEKDQAGTRVLHLAATLGRAEVAERLIEAGAEVDGTGMDGGTALMSAAFFGRVETLQILIRNGADVNAQNKQGNTVLDTATMDFSVVKMVGEALAIPVDEGMEERRKECAELLRQEGAKDDRDHSMDWYWMGVFAPIFHHLWFLYYLLWLVAIFLPAALIWRKLGWKIPDWVIKTPGCLIWLIPLTLWPQMHMPGLFGPGTAIGIFPWGAKLGYYGVFFFFGAMCFGRGWWENEAGRLWWIWLLAAIPVLWVGRQWIHADDPFAGQVCAVVYAWLMIVGLMGLFRCYLNDGHPGFRYLSDSSYWLYLAHMPLILALQIWLSNWEVSAFFKFPLIVLSVTGVLLVVYEYCVRYTWIGAILNGRKYRTPPLPKDSTS